MSNLRSKLVAAMRQAADWGDRRIPRGLRSLVGILFVIGGIVGFLPILGFWMLPVGLTLIALDIPPLRRRLRAWIARNGAADGARRAEPRHFQPPDRFDR